MNSRKFRRAVIHAGGDKTGSTAIQKTLAKAAPALAQARAVAFPPWLWQTALGSWCCERPESFVLNLEDGEADMAHVRRRDAHCVEQLGQWLERVPPCETLVLSYEGYAFMDVPALARLRAYCEQWAEEVSVVMYVRGPLSYALSAMSQRVKQGRPAWQPRVPPIAPYRDSLAAMVAAFGKERLQVRRFARETLRDGDVIGDFLEVVGVSVDLAATVRTHKAIANESLSGPAMSVGALLAGLLTEQGVVLPESLFHERYGKHLGAIPGDRPTLEAEQAEAVRAAAAPNCEYLRQEFGIEFAEAAHDFVARPDRDARTKDPIGFAVEQIFLHLAEEGRRTAVDFALAEVAVLGVHWEGGDVVESGQVVAFDVDFCLAAAVDELVVQLQFFDRSGRLAFGIDSGLLGQPLTGLAPGTHRARFFVAVDLPDGDYVLGCTLRQRGPDGLRELARYGRVAKLRVASVSPVPGEGYLRLASDLRHRQLSGELAGMLADGAGSLVPQAPLPQLVAGGRTDLPVRLHNASTQAWVSSACHPIRLCYRWLDTGGQAVVSDGLRSPLPAARIEAGETVTALMEIKAPKAPGDYLLRLLPVMELRCWFDAKGFTVADLPVQVVAEAPVAEQAAPAPALAEAA